MTNATVADEVVAADGTMLKLTYKGGEQTLTLTPETRVFTVAPASLADLKPGSAVNMTIEKDASGDLQTNGSPWTVKLDFRLDARRSRPGRWTSHVHVMGLRDTQLYRQRVWC